MEIQEADVRREIRAHLDDETYFRYCDVIDEVVPSMVRICQRTSIEDFRMAYLHTVDHQASLMRSRDPFMREQAASLLFVAHEIYRTVEQLAGGPTMRISYKLPGPDS